MDSGGALSAAQSPQSSGPYCGRYCRRCCLRDPEGVPYPLGA